VTRLTREEAGPFQINVKVGKRRSSIADVGYGVSQTLPIVMDMLEAPEPSAFLFQQPEVHLHPRAQAGLGTFFAQFAAQHPDSFVVAETHSDYLIDRVRLEVRNRTISKDFVSMLYFEDKGENVEIHEILLDEYGNVSKAPACYREFFFREQLSLLALEDGSHVHSD
jgi:predicted ATPase